MIVIRFPGELLLFSVVSNDDSRHSVGRYRTRTYATRRRIVSVWFPHFSIGVCVRTCVCVVFKYFHNLFSINSCLYKRYPPVRSSKCMGVVVGFSPSGRGGGMLFSEGC